VPPKARGKEKAMEALQMPSKKRVNAPGRYDSGRDGKPPRGRLRKASDRGREAGVVMPLFGVKS